MAHSTRPLAALLIASLLPAAPALGQIKEVRRLEECREVVRELARSQEGIPGDLLDKAECVAVIPGVFKAALGFGGRWGYGAVVCRTDGGLGPWGPPLMISLKGGSFGLQIGGQSTDFVFLVMNPKGIDYLLRSKFTLGADASVAAGPIGRSAEAGTDARMRAEILSYSRSRGLFIGISLDGSSVYQDRDANERLYGRRLETSDVVREKPASVPDVVKAWWGTLGKYF